MKNVWVRICQWEDNLLLFAICLHPIYEFSTWNPKSLLTSEKTGPYLGLKMIYVCAGVWICIYKCPSIEILEKSIGVIWATQKLSSNYQAQKQPTIPTETVLWHSLIELRQCHEQVFTPKTEQTYSKTRKDYIILIWK